MSWLINYGLCVVYCVIFSNPLFKIMLSFRKLKMFEISHEIYVLMNLVDKVAGHLALN